MSRTLLTLFAVALGATLISCGNYVAPGSSSPLSSAFTSLPLGFQFVPSTFAGGSAADSDGWAPPDGHTFGAIGEGGHGGRGGPGDGSMMCGGVGGAFHGDGLGLGFGHGFDRGLFGGIFAGISLPGTCAFDAGSGRVICDPATHDGLTITRSAAYLDGSGTTQSAFDSLTTNSINIRVTVAGTKVRHDNDTSVVQHTSDRTVAGLAPGSMQRTVNGSSSGTENIKGSNTTGSFTAVRTIGDTIAGVVIPQGSGMGFPTAGTVVRSAQVVLTYAGQSPTTSTRREVITYNGSGTATVTITRDGVTQNCTLAPRSRPVCQ
jgi:hypothetical protein